MRLEADDHTVPFNSEESLAELRELTTSAGGVVVGELLQRRDRPDAATLIGSGKVEEIAAAAKMASSDVIIFDHELSSSQLRNLEREFHCRVVDRTQLILDIFARHARTREGQLQVELAQLEYMLPRLAGRGTEMSQLGGGIGTRGPGETQLERTDRRSAARSLAAASAAGEHSGSGDRPGGLHERGEVHAVQCAYAGRSAGERAHVRHT
jgi:GTP-binding protein HflX